MTVRDGRGFLQISIGLRTPMSLKAANSLSNGFENLLESPLRSPEENLLEAPPIPDIRRIIYSSFMFSIFKYNSFIPFYFILFWLFRQTSISRCAKKCYYLKKTSLCHHMHQKIIHGSCTLSKCHKEHDPRQSLFDSESAEEDWESV